MEEAAKRWGCEFLEVTEPIDPERPLHEQKWLVPRLFKGSQVVVRAFVVDPLTLIREDAPNIFEVVPEGKIGAAFLKQPGNKKTKKASAAVLKKYAQEKGLEWDEEGVQMPRTWAFDAFTFDWPRHRPLFEDMHEEVKGAECLTDEYAIPALWTRAFSVDGLMYTLPNCWNRSGRDVWGARSSLPGFLVNFNDDPEKAAEKIEDLDFRDTMALVDQASTMPSDKTGPPAKKPVIYFGCSDPRVQRIAQRYAEAVNRPYQFVNAGGKWRKSWDELKNAALVVIWNGKQGNTLHASQALRQQKIPMVFIEWGMLPQKTTYFVDIEGLHESSMLMGNLSWVTDKDVEALKRKRAELQKRYPLAPQGHVLVPLQICNDTSITYSTTIRTMEDFMETVQDLYPEQEVFVRPHPKAGWVPTNHRFKMTRNPPDFLEACSKASVVVGLTSTTLVEAAVLGVPVVAFGNCPLRNTPRRQRDRLLAAYNYLTISRDKGDIKPILDRFNVFPVGD